MSKPKVSIILPSLNVSNYIEECIESVINQTLQNIEILCVDAGSTDGTLEVLREYEKNDLRVKVIVSEKKSYGHQMNLGLNAATGEYIGIVETDDYVSLNMYNDLYDIAQREQLDFVKADFYRFKNKGENLELSYNKLDSSASYYNKLVCPNDDFRIYKFIMNTWSGIYNRDFLTENNILHNESLGASYQDNGFWFQTFMYAKRAFFINKPYYYNRRDNENSSVFNQSKVYCMRDEYDYIRSVIDRNLDKYSFLIPLFNYFRFCGYYYNTLNRIAFHLKKDFLDFFSNEFYSLINTQQINFSFFTNDEKELLNKIVYDKDSFYNEISLENDISIIENNSDKKEEIIPLLSIIIPVYNCEEYIAEALDSVITQSEKNIEVICVDDGSTDNSLEILKEYEEKDMRIRVFHKENTGLASTRNFALNLATGEFVLFLDADDGFAPNAFNRIITVAKKDTSDIVVFSFNPTYYPLYSDLPEWLNTKKVKKNITYNNFMPNIFFDVPGAVPFVWTKCFRRDFLKKHSLVFQEDMIFAEDTVFLFEAFSLVKNISFITDELYYYRCSRPSSLMNTHNDQSELKMYYHLMAVRQINSLLQRRKTLDLLYPKFATWATNFVLGVFTTLDEDMQKSMSKEVINVLDRVYGVKGASLLGEGNKKRVEDIKAMRDLCLQENNQKIAFDSFKQYEKASNPKVTFIVPVYNGETHILTCLNSLLNQTMQEIEVVCVNDASTDNTGFILSEVAKLDSRLSIITYTENRTSSQARKDAVLAANGEYILFCDADDTYNFDAANKLYAEIQKKPVDILHYEIEIVGADASEADKIWLQENIKPYIGVLNGRQVFLSCFRDKNYDKALWNKMFNASFAKKAFVSIKDGAFERGQDLYAYFVLAYFATTYRGITTDRFYNYHLGSGGDGKKHMNKQEFLRFCSLSKISAAINDFLIEQDSLDEYSDIWNNLQSNLLGDCINKWHTKVDLLEKGECLDMLLEKFPKWMLVESISRRYWNNMDGLTQIISDSKLKSVTKTNIKTIAMYYHKLLNGGVENVMLALSKIYIAMGYKVILITDVQGEEDFVELPKGTKRFTLPNYGLGDPNKYYRRAKKLNQILEEQGIEVVLYHAWNTGLLIYDMLQVKSCNIPFVVHCHSIFSMRMLENSDYYSVMSKVFSLSDGIVCLSDVDKIYWEKFNSNVFLMCNPIPFDIKSCEPSRLDSKIILWIGRLSPEKQPDEAIHIFSEVLKSAPNAKLHILGEGEAGYVLYLKNIVKNLKLSKNIDFLGYQSDVRSFLKEATILLSTSKFEGFQLTILEGKAYGLPIVLYDLPYLYLSQGNRGMFPIKPGDVNSASKTIMKIFSDVDLRESKGKESRDHALEIAQFNYEKKWKNIFESLSLVRSPPAIGEDEKLMWETLFQHYKIGVNQKNLINSSLDFKEKQQYNQSNQRLKQLNKQYLDIENSISFRIGKTITFFPRKIRRLFCCVAENGILYTFRLLINKLH